MGVIHKLKPEIIDFILENKKANPNLSCRGLAALIESTFQTKVSKSSINAVIKQSGLSMPVGRRRTKRHYVRKAMPLVEALMEEKALTLAEAAEREAAEAEEKARLEVEARAKAEAEEKARLEAEERMRLEAETKARAEAEEQARREAEERAKLLAEAQAKAEAERKAREEAERKTREEAIAKAKAEAEAKAKAEAEAKAKAEAEELARQAALEKARREAEEKARAEAEAKAEAEQRAKEEAERRAREEALAKARAEAEEKAKREAEERARREAEEKTRLEAEEKAKAEAEARARQEAEERARREAEEKARLEAEERMRLEAETKARAEAEARAKAEAEEKARQEAEEKARREAEEKARAAAEEKARAEAEAKAKAEAEELARQAALEKARREAEEKARAEAEAKAEAEQRAKEEAASSVEDLRLLLNIAEDKLEAEAKAKEEAERKAREEAERKARQKAEAEEKAAKAQETIPSRVEELTKSPELIPGMGAILLRAADCLLGGTFYITETIKHHLSREEKDPLAKVENLLYLSLFRSSEQAKDLEIPGRGPLIGKKLPLENILSCRKVLEEVKGLPLEIFQAISSQFQEVRGIKVSLSDGTTFYLDSQLHTVWSTPHIPYDFSNSAYYLKRYLNKYFQEDKPLVIFMAPGYDSPTKEFFDFMVGLDETSRRIVRLSLFGNKFEELGEIPAGQRVKKHFYAFGLGPWQFREYRKVSKMGEFRKFYFAPLKEDFYIAEVEMELSRPNQNKTIALTGCALKRKPDEKTRLVILSNMVIGGARIEELANIYLSRWPNLEEAFQDFSQKIELFTYTASSQRFFSTEGLDLNREAPVDINAIFGYYLKVLDLYARWHFLPADYEDKDFAAMKEQFYALPGQWNKENGYLFVNFKPAAGFLFLEHLKYACRRINEREIVFPDGHKLCCSVG